MADYTNPMPYKVLHHTISIPVCNFTARSPHICDNDAHEKKVASEKSTNLQWKLGNISKSITTASLSVAKLAYTLDGGTNLLEFHTRTTNSNSLV
jgi:hypothetical protein